MSANYSPGTPVDKYGIAKYNYPPSKVALVTNNQENVSVSSMILLGHDTTEIEVVAISSVLSGDSSGVAGRWISSVALTNGTNSVFTGASSTVSSPNFDFVVKAGQVRRFVVPVAQINQAQQSIQGVNRLQGLYLGVAYKVLAGTGSVLTMEF